jgi:hypothetical protein
MGRRLRRLGLGLGLALALGAVPWTLMAQVGGERDGVAGAVTVPLQMVRLAQPITLDGVPTDDEWGAVPPLPLTMYYPTFRGAPAERSEIRVAYDGEYLYASGRFYDSDPSGIRINSLYRDRWNGDDAFAIYVDAFNDNENAKWFGVTAAAMRFDQLVSDDGAVLNGSWDGFWDAEAMVTEEGWFAEVRIPLSTIGFQADASGDATMGLTVTRLVSRTGERVTFPAIDPQFEFRQPSVAQDVVLRGVESHRPAYVSPYVSAGFGRTQTPTATGFEPETAWPREVGLDVRYALSSNLSLDVTANTDFAQVEADDRQVNLDRFSLFFPEKRRFFQEGSGLFDFDLGGGSRLFHSRRIGLTDDNRSVPILGGARVVGRLGAWDVAVLDMQTDDIGGIPTENFGVARLRRRVFNDYSDVGAMVTTRVREGVDNVVAGLDGSFRVVGDHYLTTRWAASNAPDDPSLLEASRVYGRWERRANRGLAYQMAYTYAGPSFDPQLGFLQRRDVSRANVFANYFIFTDDHAYFRRVYPGFLAFSTLRNGDRTVESGQYAVWVQWETKAGGGGWLEPKAFVEDVLTPFQIGGEVDIPAGRYTFADFQAVWFMPSGRRLRTSIDARAGTFFDGTRVQVIANPTWNVSRHLELGADYQWTRLRFGDRDQETDIHLLGLRVRAALDSRASGNAFVQYDSTADRLDVNLRLRYNFAEGRDLWLVVNEGLVTDRLPDPTAPALPRSMSRTLILKYTHTWGA